MARIKKQTLKKRPDGRYCCTYHGKFFYGRTSDEALAAREEYKRREAAGEFAPENTRLSAYGARWLQAYKSHLTTAPYNQHVRMIEKFIDTIGDIRLRDVTPTDIARFFRSFDGYSASTIHDARDTVRGIFRAALADGLIDRDPTFAVPIPKGTKGTHRAITEQERELILKTPHRLRPAVMTMLYAGLRRGEVLSLRVDRDVDFSARTITVREAVRFNSVGHPVLVDPKTEAGIRTIPLLDILADSLRDLHGLVCPSARGALMTESAWSRAWESYLYALAVALNGFPRRGHPDFVPVQLRAHDLRHSYCTMLYDAGVDLKTAMLWMGHADQTMTMRVYTHLSENRRISAEKMLRNAVDSPVYGQNHSQDPDASSETQ